MSTATTTGRPAPQPPLGRATPDLGGRPGIPLGRLLRVELRKLVDTRSGRWLLITIAAVTAAALVLTWAVMPGSSLTFTAFLEAASSPQGILLPILGILSATAESSQRTGLVTYTQEPRRLRVVLAKAIAVALLGLVAALLAVGLAALAALLAHAVKDAPAVWDGSPARIGGMLLEELLSVVKGLAFGLLVLVPGLAIAAYFVIPMLLPLTNLVSWLSKAAPWIDESQSSGKLLQGAMTGSDWAHLASSTAIWTLLPLAVGSWLLLRREIK